MKKFKINNLNFKAVILLVLLSDQLSKFLVLKFGISYVTNTGIAFGFFKGANWLFILLTLAIVLVIFFNFEKNWMTGLIIGGALGNLTDRILRNVVVDFIHSSFWPSFNIADSAITIGGIFLAIKLFKK